MGPPVVATRDRLLANPAQSESRTLGVLTCRKGYRESGSVEKRNFPPALALIEIRGKLRIGLAPDGFVRYSDSAE